MDRGAWVSAGELEEGETLKTLTGTTQVESITRRPKQETVYNIEVEGDHVYRVGESGILVHNASDPNGNTNNNASSQEQPDHVFATGFGKSMKNWAKLVRCAWPDLADSLDAQVAKTQTDPFKLTVTRDIPRPDAHSVTFGKAIDAMDKEVNAFLETAARDGNDKARKAHASKLQLAWEAVVDAVEDKDVAALVQQGQKSLVSKGKKTLLEIKFAVSPVINKG